MKRIMILLLVAIMVLSAGCSEEPSVTTTTPATQQTTQNTTEGTDATQETTEVTEEPTVPAPACIGAQVQVENAPAILQLLNRGNVVDVVGEYDEDHYVIKTDMGYGLVEKQFLWMSDGEVFQTWTGYASGYIGVYDNFCLFGDPVKNVGMNTRMEVLAELNYCYLVQVGETIGYAKKNHVSKYYIEYNAPDNKDESGQDGGDISLYAGGVTLLSVIEQSGEVTGTAVVLVDKAPVVLGYFQMGDTVDVIVEEGFAPQWEGYHTLYLGDFCAYMPAVLTLTEEEDTYETWDGYAAYGSDVYDNYQCQGDGKRLGVNTVVTVLWHGGEFCVVSVNGDVGYMDADQISSTPYYTGGGNAGSGSNDTESDSEWTPPAM